MQALIALRRISMSASVARGRDWIIEGWWIRDHKPDPWPETPEERKAAALKYGLREEDYVSMPRDAHVGNYPDLGLLNYDLKDPYEDWSYDGMRRNFNEPMPYMFNMIHADRYTFTGLEYMSPRQAFRNILVMFGGFLGLIWLSKQLIPTNEVPKPKQYAYDYELAWPFKDPKNFPLVHYTFEPADSD
ncbi:NADH ubiquinone oxidoreductase ASHI subunit [Trichuris trichiura]|uniref:NADH ubiquinone oxidoreductase ASHI subunit n=1 Tax=Trichuris trichiura TaxID=36087 RepID=A0A077ZMI1_TRITR|nr:NADH ubiquinone oxidoreductase ASHI subunit [Trichuris trichiura]